MMLRSMLMAACVIGLAAPALAQVSSAEAPPGMSSQAAPAIEAAPAGAPISSADALKLFVDACMDVSSGEPTAYDRINAAGWTPNETADTGPYSAVYSGYRDLEGYGEVDIWGAVQSFPTQRLGYCRLDFGDTGNLLDLSAMAGIDGLVGSAEAREGGNVYGAWESPDKTLLVIGDRTDGAVEIEFNHLLGDKPKQ